MKASYNLHYPCSYDHVIECIKLYDDTVYTALGAIKQKLIEHFTGDNWNNNQIEKLVGEPLTADFLEKWDKDYLENLLDSDDYSSVEELYSFARNICNIDLGNIKIPYKIIILDDNEYTLTDKSGDIENLFQSEENIPAEMIIKYEVCFGKAALIDRWKDLLKEYEGCLYAVKSNDGTILCGSYDPNDIENIEQLPDDSHTVNEKNREIEL